MALHIVFLFLYIFLSTVLSASELYFVCVLHMLIYIGSNFYQQRVVTPIILFALGVVVVDLGNVALIDEVVQGTVTTYSYIVPAYIDDAAQIWCVSITIIIMGYILAAKKSLPAINFDVKREHLKIVFYLLLLVNIIIIFSATVSLKTSLQIFNLLNTFGILFFARLWGKEDNKTFASYAIILLVLETYIALATSYLRSEVIFPMVCLFIGYFIGKGKVRYVFSYRVAPFVFVGVIYATAFSAMELQRSNFLGFFLDKKVENPNQVKVDKKDALLIRSANLAQMTNVINLVHENGFYNGTASYPLLVAVIPRVLWPEKPKIQLGAWFALEIGQANIVGDRVNNSINMTVMGEMYLDFGWPGVILGSLLLGALVAMLWNSTHFYGSVYNLNGSVFGGYILLILLIGLAADLQIVITFFSYYLSFYILKYIVKLLYLNADK